MFAVYLFNLESIYSQSTSQISEEKKVEITYLSTVWNVHWCLIVLVYILILVVNIDQSTSSFICYTSFKKLKFPQITVNKLLRLFQAWLHFFLFSDLNYWYINTNNTKFDSTCHIVQRHDPQEDIIFIKITKHMTHKITYCQMLASVVT